MAKVKGLRYIKARQRYYAVHAWRDSEGRQHQLKECLRTQDQLLAIQRLPEALRRLCSKAKGSNLTMPLKPTDKGLELNTDTNQWEPILAGDVLDPEEFNYSWQQAAAIHAQRKEERQGRPLADSTLKIIDRAIRGVPKTPITFTTADVRQYLDGLKAQGLQPITIRKLAVCLQGVTSSLIKSGYVDDTFTNPWTRIDFSAQSRNHHHVSTPQEICELLKLNRWEFTVMIKCGFRVDELSHLKLIDGWLVLEESANYRPKTDTSIRRIPSPVSEIGTPLSRQALNERIKKVAPLCTNHSLRSGFKTACMEALLPTEITERLLGHALGPVAGAYGAMTDTVITEAIERVWEVVCRWGG
jgi:integrase